MLSSSPRSDSSDATASFKLYHYDPNRGAAGAFVALFILCTIVHLYKLVRGRTWFFIPFIIGLAFEAAGYVGRNISAGETPNWTTGPYILQSLTLLLGPTLLAASIYMALGRLIRLLNADRHSIIRTTWLTKVFVLGDVLSFLTQSGGGGMLAKAKTQADMSMGENIIMGGLFIQIIFFGFFIVVTYIFHRRIVLSPTPTSRSIGIPWRRFLYVMYAASVLIMVRSIFRVAEYAGGYSGPLQSSEAYIYIFDATLMFIVAALFGVWHPGSMMTAKEKGAIPLSDGDGNMYENSPRYEA
ncbi:unnamed protein product [Clonostachys rosea f. rosea IK726]|uniref:RTA1 domain protein n=2 Tax=Bionectria ochroleuca TaxID=29856 RepID=A0A0B7K908_BIOOC|nr:unnamed protein product [Clonostachys rosea f. rosea IK726]